MYQVIYLRKEKEGWEMRKRESGVTRSFDQMRPVVKVEGAAETNESAPPLPFSLSP